MTQPAATRTQTLFFARRYADARTAITWLEAAFGAMPHVVYDDADGGVAHAELSLAGNIFMLGSVKEDDIYMQPPGASGTSTSSSYVVLPDAATVDALHERARNAGATIIRSPYDTEYGSHDFSALDCDGHPWTFGTYAPGEHS